MPFAALALLIYIEHYMKEIARRQSHDMRKVNLIKHLKETDKKYNKATWMSMVVIALSCFELLFTMYICMCKF